MQIRKENAVVLHEYAQHLKNLTTEDRYTRFGYSIKDETIDAVILNILYNPNDHHLFVAEVDDKIIGFGHLAREGADWELAVSVDHDYQGQGIGNALMDEMIKWGKLHDVHSVFMHCITENRKIQHLARKHGLRTVERSGAEITAQVELPDPTIVDYARNYLAEQRQLMSQMTELQKKFWASLAPGALFDTAEK